VAPVSLLLLATYPSSHAVLKAEKRLYAAGLRVELIPVPRQIRSSCGFCLLCDIEGHLELLQESGVEGLWRVLGTEHGHSGRRYEPYP
jgi:hypothetical protein